MSEKATLSPEQEQFLEWLILRDGGGLELIKDKPQSVAAYGHEHKIPDSTLNGWEKSPALRDEYLIRVQEDVSDPRHLNRMATKLRAAALDGDRPNTEMYKLYMNLMERIRPTEPLEREKASVSDLTDQELHDLVVGVASLRGSRIDSSCPLCGAEVDAPESA